MVDQEIRMFDLIHGAFIWVKRFQYEISVSHAVVSDARVVMTRSASKPNVTPPFEGSGWSPAAPASAIYLHRRATPADWTGEVLVRWG